MEGVKDSQLAVSKQAFRRMPQYYNYIKVLKEQGIEAISAPAIAKKMGLNEVQVRKDFAAVSANGGKPRTGFDVVELLSCIEKCLGYNNVYDAVLVGAGQLGCALLSYEQFEEYGVRIIAAFDSDEAKIGKSIHNKTVFPMQKLKNLCDRLKMRIGIICVPAPQAQQACDLLIDSGILAIWNFAPVHLVVPNGILVQTENMAVSLSLLSQHLAATM